MAEGLQSMSVTSARPLPVPTPLLPVEKGRAAGGCPCLQLATPPAFGNPSPRESYETENRSHPAHPQQLRFGAKNQLTTKKHRHTGTTNEAKQIRLGARAQERGFSEHPRDRGCCCCFSFFPPKPRCRWEPAAPFAYGPRVNTKERRC